METEKLLPKIKSLLSERVPTLQGGIFSIEGREFCAFLGEDDTFFSDSNGIKTINTNLAKIELQEGMEVFFADGLKGSERRLFFEVKGWKRQEVEDESNTEGTIIAEEGISNDNLTGEQKNGLENIDDLYRFKGLKDEEVQRILYCLYKTCPEDGWLYYRELLKAKCELRLPSFLLAPLDNLNEEHRIIVSEYGQEHRVALFVFNDEEVAESFNRKMADSSDIYQDQILNLVGDRSTIMAITAEVLTFYKRIASKLKNRVLGVPRTLQYTECSDYYDEIVNLLDEN